MEQWKKIPGYEGIYEASTEGRIRGAEGKITYSKHHGRRVWQQHVMTGRGHGDAGYRVGLWKDGKHRDWLVARIVALTWCMGYEKGMTVNHINGNRFDNRAINLEWLTLADNIRHGFDTGLYSCQCETLLKANGETFTFRSMSLAGQYIGRNSGYISGCVKRKRAARSISGQVFDIEVNYKAV